MDRRVIWGGAAAGALLLFVVAYFASPLFAIGALKSALEKRDRDRLEQLIDFPQVRENLKADLNAQMLAKVQSDPELQNNPFAGLAVMFAPVIVERAIDTVVTPAALANMWENGTARGALSTTPAADKPARPEVKAKSSYAGLNRFRVEQRDDDGKGLTWVFARQGLFHWRLIRVELGAGLFEEAPKATPAETPASPPPAPVETAEASVQPMPLVGSCSDTSVAETGPRLEGVPESGSFVSYADGTMQVSYHLLPGIINSQPGDGVRVCVVSLPEDCPPGDNRGITYRATNLRTGESWVAPDSSHMCGGA